GGLASLGQCSRGGVATRRPLLGPFRWRKSRRMVQIVRLMVLAAIAVLASLPFHHASTATATTAAGVEPSWQPASERSQPVRRQPYAGEELKNPDWVALQVAWLTEFDAAQPAAAAAQGPAAPAALTAGDSGAIPQ